MAKSYDLVTPCMGVWIEIISNDTFTKAHVVTPCMGVWIEIKNYLHFYHLSTSLPVWECGLK